MGIADTDSDTGIQQHARRYSPWLIFELALVIPHLLKRCWLQERIALMTDI